MTHISYLNDPTELQHAVESIKEMLQQLPRDTANDQVIQHLIKRLEDLTPATYYVASFSANGDKLSQWRSYASDGSGVAIGFDVPEWTRSDDGPFMFYAGPVKYGTEGLEQEVARIQRHFSEETHRWQEPVFDGEKYSSYESTAHWLADEIYKLAAFHKHQGFSEEEEWRWTLRYDFGTPRVDPGAESSENSESKERTIARSVMEDLRSQFAERRHFRKGKYGLTPYIDFDFGSHGFNVKEVVLGPRTIDRVTKPAFELLRQSLGLTFDIGRSEIPYR